MIPPDYTSLPARFWDRVEVDEKTGCWVFIGSGTSQGYVKFTEDYQHIYAHRLAAADYYGPIPEGMLALHHCDNPPCVYYEHLYIGSRQDNMDDMHLKGRHAHGESHGTALNPESIVKGEKRAFAKLNPESVQTIRSLAAQGISFRAIANRFGVSVSTAWRAARGVKWGHV